MSISFQQSSPYPLLNCAICCDSLEKDVVIHKGKNDGEKHPFHNQCVKEWLKKTPSCPVCRVNINPDSLNSLKEKIILLSKGIIQIRASILVGIGTGILNGFIISTMALADTPEERRKILFQINAVKLTANILFSSITAIAAASLTRFPNELAGYTAFITSSLASTFGIDYYS